jgi:hypothetical protein
MNIMRQIKRSRERKREKEKTELIKQLKISDFEYKADDQNMTFSAMGPHLVDFLYVTGLAELLQEKVHIDKRNSPYSPAKLSQLLILQNIVGVDRIENSRILDQDELLKRKLNLDSYPDPETLRDELRRYAAKNIEELFLVNQGLLDILCKLTIPQYVDLHFDSKVITVYGDQEKAQVGYNPHKIGRASYHLKVCTIEPFGVVLGICLQPGDAVSSTDFVEFYQKCIAALPQNHLVVQNVRLDSGFFSEENIEAFEGDCLFFEVVAKKYRSLKHWITECMPDDDFHPLYPGHTIEGAPLSFRLASWDKPRDFVIVRKIKEYEDNGQGMLFPKWCYQVICHNQLDMSPREVWEDYNKRATVELHIRELDYDHFITKVPTGNFLSNYAYFWHCVLSYNLMIILKNFLLPPEWSKARTSTLRKKLISIPGRLVNHSGRMVMRLMAGFPFTEVLTYVKERLLWLYRMLHPLPV